MRAKEVNRKVLITDEFIAWKPSHFCLFDYGWSYAVNAGMHRNGILEALANFEIDSGESSQIQVSRVAV